MAMDESASQARDTIPVRPLNARSVVLSTLLGYHPPALPVSALVRSGGLFGIAEGAIRVALGRMVVDGDLIASNRTYRLTKRLIARQRRQDDSCSPRTRKWDGDWEMEVVTAPPRPLADRVALRRSMADLRLAELREGVWMRPANLIRDRHATALEQCTFFRSRLQEDPELFVRTLWDLDTWAADARGLHHEIGSTTSLVEGFLFATAVYRHLRRDPVLPPELLPADWPGTALRERWAQFSSSYAQQLREYLEE